MRLLLLVEGQTEEAFVDRVLAPHLLPFGIISVRASLLRTREPPSGSPYKGGVTNFGRMDRDIRRLLADTSVIVTTLLDLYGLPEDFPGHADVQAERDPRKRAQYLQCRLDRTIDHPRFKSFLALHEFEAWVFAAPDVAEAHLGIPRLANHLRAVANAAGGPELVNNTPATIPSRRLEQAARDLAARTYSKVIDGPGILGKAGLQLVRAACPHFNDWLTWLEALGQNHTLQS